MVRIDSATALVPFREWTVTIGEALAIVASGGTVTMDGTDRIHTFIAGGNFEILAVPPSSTLHYLICGSGAPGGKYIGTTDGGGGGGGAVLEDTSYPMPVVGTYPVVVSPAYAYTDGSPPVNSSVFGFSAEAGGRGGESGDSVSDRDGGCGGGGLAGSGGQDLSGGNGSPGKDGGAGAGVGFSLSGGGGGGMTEKGKDGQAVIGGEGGDGLTSSISGTSYTYGSGGGSGTDLGLPNGVLGGHWCGLWVIEIQRLRTSHKLWLWFRGYWGGRYQHGI